MLIIRKSHKDTFGKVARQKFEDRATEHCRRVFKDDCEKLGDETLRSRIAVGTDAAGTYGIRKERDVIRYVDLMFILSEDFDKNPSFPWAAKILKDEALGGTTKMDRLWDRVGREIAMLAEKHKA